MTSREIGFNLWFRSTELKAEVPLRRCNYLIGLLQISCKRKISHYDIRLFRTTTAGYYRNNQEIRLVILEHGLFSTFSNLPPSKCGDR